MERRSEGDKEAEIGGKRVSYRDKEMASRCGYRYSNRER